MLVLSRKLGETIRIGSEVQLVVLDVTRGRVKLGFEGPREVPVRRGESTVSKPLEGVQAASVSPMLNNNVGKPAVAPLHAFRTTGG